MNKKATIWVIILLILVAAGGAWVYFATKPSETANNEKTDTTKNTEENSPPVNNETGQETAATITATNDGFTPNTVTVKKGQSIKVVNDSSSPIEFSSADHPTHLQDPELNMSELQPGESGTITVTNAGTHGYHDHQNPSHTGKIIVTE
jgi:plastocyanin